MGRSDNQSFLHPPAQSNPPSEAEMGGMLGVTQQRGPVHGINPLGNAIDIRTCAQWSARVRVVLAMSLLQGCLGAVKVLIMS
jgi:hypothetical protein